MSIKNFLSSRLKIKHRGSSSLENRMGYSFKNSDLKTRALIHKSFAVENKKEGWHNERLEFLGDAVFDLCVSDLLMKEYPLAEEGDLSKMRAGLVNTHNLAELALSLGLDKDIKLSAVETKNRGNLKPRLLASVLEALVGAVYLDGGYSKAKNLVAKWVGSAVKKGLMIKDYKSLLQEQIQKKFRKIPTYRTVQVTGPPHEKIFCMEVRMEEKILGTGKGPNKKKATQEAALFALKKLGYAFKVESGHSSDSLMKKPVRNQRGEV